MTGNVCRECRYFNGFDGVGELWITCSIHGDFKVQKTNCEYFEKKITKADLLRKIRELEREIEQLKKQVKKQILRIHCQDKEIQRLLEELKNE